MAGAIITGAGSGIGRATALALATRGYAVALVGRTPATLHGVAREILAAGGMAEVIRADVSRPTDAERMVERAAKKLGRIDLLVNNAGVAPAVQLAKMSVEQWRAVLDTNLSSAFYTTRAVWPIMVRQHAAARRKRTKASAEGTGGLIVNISSMASRDPFPGLGAYGAAKAAVNLLTLMAAREGDAVGIHAMAIAPGAVETPMFRKFVAGQKIPADIVMQPDNIAALIVEAATGSLRYSSGETLFVHRRPA